MILEARAQSWVIRECVPARNGVVRHLPWHVDGEKEVGLVKLDK